MFKLFCTLLLGVGVASSTKASTIVSNFDYTDATGTDFDGWVGHHGTLLHVLIGGNPNGFLQETDTETSNMSVFAPAKFLIGDLTGYSISVDIKQFAATAGTFGGFGALTLYNGTSSMVADLGDPVTSWTHYSASLSSLFGGDPSYAAIIVNVTKIQLALDPTNRGSGEVVGMDNFTLTNGVSDSIGTPEPASLGLMGVGLIGFSLFRRRRSVDNRC